MSREDQKGGKGTLILRAAMHELRCGECRVTWKSWALRLLTAGRLGMTP